MSAFMTVCVKNALVAFKGTCLFIRLIKFSFMKLQILFKGEFKKYSDKRSCWKDRELLSSLLMSIFSLDVSFVYRFFMFALTDQ